MVLVAVVLAGIVSLTHNGLSARAQPSALEAGIAAVMRKLEEAAAEKERVVLLGREIYAWHPDGIGRSRLWTLLAGRGLGVTATARNWTTVTTLLELADR